MSISSAALDISDRAAPVILIVDDDIDILPEYQELLEIEGIATLTSADPLEAVSLAIARSELQLIITDLRMEKLDGLSLIEQIRNRLEPERKLGFIILTGDANYVTHQPLPGVPVLLKPVPLAPLVAAIRTLLSSLQSGE